MGFIQVTLLLDETPDVLHYIYFQLILLEDILHLLLVVSLEKLYQTRVPNRQGFHIYMYF